MKKLVIVSFLLSTIAIEANSQSIKASRILDMIEDGESVVIENATITGHLDLARYFEKSTEDPYDRKKKWWRSVDNTVEEIVRVELTFINCTFEDDVLAYVHDEDTQWTFIASFDRDVVFKNCNFEGKSAFKYSEFEGEANFEGSKFRKEALFKYAEFKEFSNFQGALFSRDANFKYAEFEEGLDFSETRFNWDLNLKYAEIHGKFYTDGMKVENYMDVKYTEVNGRSYSSFKSRNTDL